MELDGVGELSYQFLTELHHLGHNLVELVKAGQAKQVKPTTAEYFSRFLERNKKGRFLLPDSHRAFLEQVAHLPLSPLCMLSATWMFTNCTAPIFSAMIPARPFL